MKKFYQFSVCLSLLLFASQSLSAQNLVPNAGFEIQDTCPAVSEILLAPPWNSPTTGTPDLFNSTCGSQNSSARTGIGSSGVYAYSTFPNNREYIQAPLTSTLVGGQTYCVSFYVIRANFRYAINRFGAYFSVGSINQSTTSNLSVTPQVENPTGTMLSAGGWIHISGTFTASGGETHIIIGNFANDANTDTLVVNAGSSSKVAIYRIDDISVTACTLGTDDLEITNGNISVFPSPATDQVTILAENGTVFTEYYLHNISGQAVKSVVLDHNTSNISMDVSSLSDGIYFLNLKTEAGIITKKLVISR